MKRSFLYILLAAAATVLLSCHKEKTDRGEGDDANQIVFTAEEGASTKALLTNTTLKTNGNRLHVLDVLTGFTGTASWMDYDQNNDRGLYIDDDVAYNGHVIWDYNSGRTYPWTTDGLHQFYAWFSYDSAMSLSADTFFGSAVKDGFSAADRTLTLPALEMTTETDQFDFLYANTSGYPMPRTEMGSVPLVLKHLFSAISIQLSNESRDDILVHRVVIEGLKNKKGAVINFVRDPATTAYPASANFINNALFYALPDATKTLTYGETYDLLGRVKNASVGEYRLIWPQTAEDLTPSDVDDLTTYPISVYYEYLSDEEHIQHTAHLRFPEGAEFKSGFRYAFTLLFTQKHIELKFKVNPWLYELNEWDFKEQSIGECTVLDFAGNEGYNKPAKTCTFVGGTPIKGTFSIVDPPGAVWSIEPVGDVEYFTISPNQGNVDHENPDYVFYIYPNLDPSLDRTTDKKLKFRFHVRFTDGSTHDANTELNYDDWTVILPKN